MPPVPVDPKTLISITLAAEEWNAVLDTLSDGKFRTVGPLIQKIVEQAQQQAQQPGEVERPRPHLQPAS